jgi:hypothetical protein
MFLFRSFVNIHRSGLDWLKPALRTWAHLVEEHSAFARVDQRPSSPYQWRSKDALLKRLAKALDRNDVGTLVQSGSDSDFDLFAMTSDERNGAFVRAQYMQFDAHANQCESAGSVSALINVVSQLHSWRRECATPPTTNWLALLFMAPRFADINDGEKLSNEALREWTFSTPEGPQCWELAVDCWAMTGGKEGLEPWSDGHYWPGVRLLGYAERCAQTCTAK